MFRFLTVCLLAVLALLLVLPFADAQTTTPAPTPRPHHHRPGAGRFFGFPRLGGFGLGALPFGAAGIYQQPVLVQQQPVLIQQAPVYQQMLLPAPAQFATGACVGVQQQFSYSGGGGVALAPGGCGVGVGGVGAAFAPGFGLRGRQFAPGFGRGFGVRRAGAVPFVARGILGALFGF